MSAKKRAANQTAEARRPKDVPRKPEQVTAEAKSGLDAKTILKWIALGLLGALLIFWVYKTFIYKPYIKPIEKTPPPVEKKDWQSTIDGERAMKALVRLVNLGPRVAGTPGSTRAQQMITAELGAAGITDIREQKFTDETPLGNRSFTNIIGVLPGKHREGIALAAHYDSKLFENFNFIGANDAASAVAVLFELARKLKPGAAERDITYYFIFFDGEEAFNERWQQWEEDTQGEKKDHTYGSRYFVRKMDDENYPVKALVLLDLVGDKDYSLADSTDFSPELMGIFRKASKDIFGVDFFVQQHKDLGDDHDPFIEKGIPAIDLIDFEYGPDGNLDYWHTQEDTVDKLSVRSLERTGTLVLAGLPEVEAMVLKGLKVGTGKPTTVPEFPK